MPLRARELLVSPLAIPPAMPLSEVQRLFVTTEITGAPVVDERGTVLGMITSNDLLRVHDQAEDDEIDEGENDAPIDQLERWTARDIATGEVVWVTPDTPAAQIAAVMRERAVHRVLVGVNGELAGIVTTFDLLRAIAA